MTVGVGYGSWAVTVGFSTGGEIRGARGGGVWVVGGDGGILSTEETRGAGHGLWVMTVGSVDVNQRITKNQTVVMSTQGTLIPERDKKSGDIDVVFLS